MRSGASKTSDDATGLWPDYPRLARSIRPRNARGRTPCRQERVGPARVLRRLPSSHITPEHQTAPGTFREGARSDDPIHVSRRRPESCAPFAAFLSFLPSIMSGTTRDPDYYDLANQNYDLTRAALKQVPPVIIPANLSPEKFRKFVRTPSTDQSPANQSQLLMKREYQQVAARLQALSRRERHMQSVKFVRAVREETVRLPNPDSSLARPTVMTLPVPSRTGERPPSARGRCADGIDETCIGQSLLSRRCSAGSR